MREIRHSGKLNLQISVNNLCLDIHGSQVLDQIDLTIDQPGVTMILGPNGAGKKPSVEMHPRAVITNTGFHRLQWIKRDSQASNGFSEARTPASFCYG